VSRFFGKSFFLPHDLNVERHSGAVDPSDVDTCVEVRNTCLYPRLMSLIPNSDVDPGLVVVTYSLHCFNSTKNPTTLTTTKTPFRSIDQNTSSR
jgi:hypothetical protein